MKKKPTLKQILIISFLFGIVLPAFSFSAFMVVFFSKKMEKEVVGRNFLLTESLAGEIDLFMAEPERIIAHISNSIDSGLVAPKSVDQYLQHTIECYQYFESIQVLDRDGVVAFAAPGSKDIIGNSVLTGSFKNFIRLGDEEKKHYFSPAFYSIFSHKTTMAISYRIGEKVFIGYLNLQFMQRIINRINIVDGDAFVLDKAGIVIAHNNIKGLEGRQYFSEQRIRGNRKSSHPRTYNFIRDGVPFLGCFQYAANGNMIVVLAQPESVIFDSVTVLKYYALFGLIAMLFLVLLFGVGILLIIIRPLNRLVVKTHDVARGDYSIEHERTGYRELETIWKNYEEMIRSVKSREDDLRWTQNYLRSIFNAQDSILVALLENGEIVQFNDAALEYVGKKEEHIKKRYFWDVFPFLKHRKKEILQSIDIRNASFHFDILFTEGESRYFSVNCYPIHFEKQQGALIRIDDVTEGKRQESQLLQMHKMETIGTLAGGFAHDMNNIMTGIMGTLSLMDMQMQAGHSITPQKLKQYVDIMSETGERASDILQQLLSISRGHKVSLSSFNLAEVIKNVVSIFRNTLDKSISLTVDFAKENALVMADKGQIEQVLLNLCVNGAHAMTIMRPDGAKWGGVLGIRLTRSSAQKDPEIEGEGEYWKLEISDTGIGMDHDLMQKIFDPFFTTKKKGEGTGLGLSMVYTIVTKHEGFLKVDSHPGEGTRISLFLPSCVKSESLSTEVEDRNLVYPRGEGLILVIDDEKVMVDIAKDILIGCGYNVITSQSATEGLALYSRKWRTVKAVLLDMSMPEISGRDLFRKMKEINSDVKVLLASGFQKDKRVLELLNEGVKGFVQKPITFTKLAHAIDAVINE